MEKLKQMRIDLANELSDVINEFGPQMYDDFDEVRTLAAHLRPCSRSGSGEFWCHLQACRPPVEPQAYGGGTQVPGLLGLKVVFWRIR